MMKLSSTVTDNFIALKCKHLDDQTDASTLPDIHELSVNMEKKQRILIELEKDTKMVELTPVWHKARVSLAHPESIQKIAFVGHVPAWLEVDKIAHTCFEKADIKAFDADHKAEALEWVSH